MLLPTGQSSRDTMPCTDRRSFRLCMDGTSSSFQASKTSLSLRWVHCWDALLVARKVAPCIVYTPVEKQRAPIWQPSFCALLPILWVHLMHAWTPVKIFECPNIIIKYTSKCMQSASGMYSDGHSMMQERYRSKLCAPHMYDML